MAPPVSVPAINADKIRDSQELHRQISFNLCPYESGGKCIGRRTKSAFFERVARRIRQTWARAPEPKAAASIGGWPGRGPVNVLKRLARRSSCWGRLLPACALPRCQRQRHGARRG